jgi:hypothetical protein
MLKRKQFCGRSAASAAGAPHSSALFMPHAADENQARKAAIKELKIRPAD